MTNTNENQNVNTETGEIVAIETQVVVRENDDFVVMQDENGKFVRKAKFSEYSSVNAESREEKMWLLNLLEGDEDSGMGLKDNIGKTLEVKDVIFRKYDRINEDTGVEEYGVLTYLITPEKEAYVTSSKTVYFSVKRMLDLFGKPGSDSWENLKLKVGKKKGTNGDIITVTMVG